MAEYSSQTVAQLKELLKGRGLSTDGKKADLVKRLQDADNETEKAQPVEATVEVTETETVATEIPTEEAPTEQAQSTELTDATAEVASENKEASKPEPKTLTPEERKLLAVDLLQKKIARAKKFGDDAGAEEAQKNLARIEKFGVEPGTKLATEIGLIDRNLGSELNSKNFRRGKKRHGKGKGGRGDKIGKK